MQKLRYFYFIAFLLLSWSAAAQVNTRGDRQENLPAVAPKKAKKVHIHPKQKKPFYKKPKVKHTAVYEYYARVEKAAKEKQKMLKELSKPQYANPLYYGHKRMPKKNPPHKMRYCKECGIRH